MRTRQFIDFGDQVTGADLLPGAREATLVARLQHALEVHLFSPPQQDGGSGGLGLDFGGCLARFRAELVFVATLKDANREVLAALGLRGGEGEPGAGEDAWARAFAMAIHAIAEAVALYHFACRVGLEESENETESEAENEAENEAAADDLPGPRQLDAVRLLAKWVERRLEYSGAEYGEPGEGVGAMADPKEAAKRTVDLVTRADVLARAMIEAAVKAVGEPHLGTGCRKFKGADGNPRDVVWIEPGQSVVAPMVRVLAAAPHVFTLQPLSRAARYPEQRELVGAARKPDETTSRCLVNWRIRVPFLDRFASTCHTPDALSLMREAVNRQQAVGWRVNRRLMEWVRVMAWLDRPPAGRAAPEWLAAFSPEVQEAFAGAAAWPPVGIQIGRLLAAGTARPVDPAEPVVLARQRRQQLTAGSGRRGRRRHPPNPFENPLVTSVFAALGMDQPESGADVRNKFFLAWFADFRGRIYPDTPWFSPQGADVQRAMLEFAEGQVLTEKGRQNLKRYGGGLAKRSLVLGDLGISGRKVLTFAERERWVDCCEEQIRASARNPLEHTFWFHASGDPLQFLAFCIEWDRQCRDPQSPCHFPVQVDGTCSGLQHMAALCGSRKLALAVNVIPRDDGLPADIYSELADAVRERVAGEREASAAGQAPQATAEAAAEFETVINRLLGERLDWITRDAAKKVVMTVPYGASLFSQTDHVLDALIDARCPLPAADAEALAGLGRLAAAGAKPQGGKAGTGKSGRTAAEDFEKLVRGGMRRLARKIAGELRRELELRYPAATRFEKNVTAIGEAVLLNRQGEYSYRAKFLSQAAVNSEWDENRDAKRMLAGPAVPIAWRAPSGLAVCQPHFLKDPASREFSLSHSGGRTRTGHQAYLPRVSVKQSHLMPNLIHSLDATHLLRSLRDLANRGVRSFGSIHDCVQCLPNDLDVAHRVIRDQFFKLYECDPQSPAGRVGLPRVLGEWHAWMELMNRVVKVADAKLLRSSFTSRFAPLVSQTLPPGLVAEISALEPGKRATIDLLIDALADEPRPEPGDLVEGRALPELGDFAVDGEGGLDLQLVYESPYFFA